MQRYIGIAVALLLTAGLVGALLVTRAPAESAVAKPRPAATATAAAKEAAKPAETVAAATAPVGEGDRDDRFNKLPDGTPVPALPASAPKTVSFGAILFAYKGAEYAPKDAPTKEQALAKARAIVKDARTNFVEAVKQGDRGSVADAGRIPQGVLERSVEHTLFSLAKGDVHSDPVDTPRGYWVLRRIE
jgi:hypothetical protein